MRIIENALACTTSKEICDEITERRVLIGQMVGSLYPSILQFEIEKLEERFQELKDLETLSYRSFVHAYALTDLDELKREIDIRTKKMGPMIASTPEARSLLHDTAELCRRLTMLRNKPEHEKLVSLVGMEQKRDTTTPVGKTIKDMRFYASEDTDQVLLIEYTDGSRTIVKSEAYDCDYGGLKFVTLPEEEYTPLELRPGVWILHPQPVVTRIPEGWDISGVPCFMGYPNYHILTDSRWPGYTRIWEENNFWVGEKQ